MLKLLVSCWYHKINSNFSHIQKIYAINILHGVSTFSIKTKDQYYQLYQYKQFTLSKHKVEKG